MSWRPVVVEGKLEPRYPARGRAGDLDLALVLVGGRIYATANVCSHAYALLCDGEVDGFELICPLHGGSFDVRDGSALSLPCIEPIAAYPVKIEDGSILVDVPDEA